MAVRPEGMFSLRCARGIEEALLGRQHKWLFGMLTSPYRIFRGSNLGKSSPHMYCSGACAFHGLPGYWAIKGKIDFEHAWSVAVALKLMLVATRQAVTGNAQQLARGHVKQDGVGRG